MVKFVLVLAALVLATAVSAESAGKQTIRLNGIYCDTGISYKGRPSVVCGPSDRTGYDVLMTRAWFALRHNGKWVMIRRNR